MDLSIHMMVFLIFSLCYGQDRPIYKTIHVPNGAKRGFWAWHRTICPAGHAIGFAIKLDRPHGNLLWEDDSSVNGLRLYCSDGRVIQSRVGMHGTWLNRLMCNRGYLESFALRVARPQPLWIFGDDCGVTNIKFRCTDGTELTGGGQTWGVLGPWSPSCYPGTVCGFRTRIDDVRVWIDTSGLNDVLMVCCL